MMPLATVVFPHPLCVPAMTRRGIIIFQWSGVNGDNSTSMAKQDDHWSAPHALDIYDHFIRNTLDLAGVHTATLDYSV
jgi:hypothetical protein